MEVTLLSGTPTHQSLHHLKKKSLKCSTRFRLIELWTHEYGYKTLKQRAQPRRTPTKPHCKDAWLPLT